MVGIRLQGQLGNQLFQIAFIRLASKMLKEFYVIIDDNAYGCIVDRYFKLRFYENKYFRRFLNFYFYLIQRKIHEFNNWQEPDEVLNSLKPDVLYKGFFQSEKFIGNTSIKNTFRVKDKYTKIFLEKYGDFFRKNKVLVIHIRLRDYLEIGDEKFGGKGLHLPFEYYQRAIEQIKLDAHTKVLVISDDYEYVKHNFKLSVPFSVEENHFIIDFLLLINANQLIISNSSFSWWGAFLNSKKDLKVIAPKFWLGFKINKNYPVEIIRSSWSTVSVY